MIPDNHPPFFYSQKVKIALHEKGVAFETVLPKDLSCADGHCSMHYGLRPSSCPPLANWLAWLTRWPSAAQTFAECDVEMARMAAAANSYRTGGRRREYRDHHPEWMIRASGFEAVRAGLRDNNIRFSWPG